MRDPHEPAPKPAVLLFYEQTEWQAVIEKFYKENPGTRGKISLVVMPKNGNFKLKGFYNESRFIKNVKTGT
jgi:hypothetical protein